MFEVGISKVMFAQVGLLVHALSILNFDGLYIELSTEGEIIRYYVSVIGV